MKKDKAIIILLVIALLIGIYFIGVFYYKNKFPTNTSINQVNVGGLTLEKADNKLKEGDAWDSITIKSDTEEFLSIRSEDIDYKYISTPDLPEILEKQNEWKWFIEIFKSSAYSTPRLYDFNEDKLQKLVGGIEELDKELLNAEAIYSEKAQAFVIEPHSYEIKITEEEISNLVGQAIDKKDMEVNIEQHIEQPDVFEDDKELIAAKDKANELLELELKYDFADRQEIVDKSVLKDLITVQEKEVVIDPEETKEYVTRVARKYDTFASNRQFKTSSGNTITTSGGSYGWLTHRGKTADELIEYIKAGENKTIEPVYSYTALRRESDDVGNSYLEIDLQRQMVYVYIDGDLKIKTPTVTGNVARGDATPPGVYPLNYKERDAVLRGENYASPVDYWMPFNGNIGLHDADWRDKFGGDIYKNSGSNGCINLPPGNAKTIFDLVYPGMPIIVH